MKMNLDCFFLKFGLDDIEDPFADSSDKPYPSDSDDFNPIEPLIKRSDFEQKLIEKNSIVS
jgi:hypothetical protein